jgi:small subunit ribosomal protein S4
MAVKRQGVTGTNLLQILECRLDNIVYRLGMGTSRAEARQLVLHAHFTVNGKKVNIPSYLVKPGDVVALKNKSRSLDKFKSIFDVTGSKVVPQWLEFDDGNMTGKVISLPEREDVDAQISEHLIVELYSK